MDIWNQPLTLNDGIRIMLATILIQAVPASGVLFRLFN
jgi:hypothetical protein